MSLHLVLSQTLTVEKGRQDLRWETGNVSRLAAINITENS